MHICTISVQSVGQSADCVMVFIERIIARLLAFDDSA